MCSIYLIFVRLHNPFPSFGDVLQFNVDGEESVKLLSYLTWQFSQLWVDTSQLSNLIKQWVSEGRCESPLQQIVSEE